MNKIILFSPTGYIGGFIKEALGQEETIQLYEIMRGSDLGQYNEEYNILVYSASVSYASASKYVQDNVVSAIKMVDFCREHGVKRIIYLSSDSIYGELHTDRVSDKAVMVNPGIYGTTKYLAEKIIVESGIASYILRMPGVVGRVWRKNFISDLMLKIKNSEDVELYNMDKAFNNVLYIDDLTSFIKILCNRKEDGRSEIFLLGNTERPMMKDIVLYIKSLYDSNAKIIEAANSDKRYFTLDISKSVEYGYISRKPKEIIDALYQLQEGES